MDWSEFQAWHSIHVARESSLLVYLQNSALEELYYRGKGEQHGETRATLHFDTKSC